jgi:hypothetical protein
MVRADRQEPDVYFGRPGALISMPWPKGGIDTSIERMVSQFATGSGGFRVSSMLGGSRVTTLSWDALHVDNYRKVEQFWIGAMGLGPWAFLNPASPNLLTENQAGATAVWNSPKDWTTSATNHGTASSNQTTTHIHRTGSPRSLKWLFSVAVAANPILTLTPPYRLWYGTPVQPGLSYAFSAWLKPDGVIDASITVGCRIQWLDAAGAQVSESDGGATAVTAWTQKSCIAVAPVGAVYANPRFVATGATITTGGSLYVDEPMFEQDTVVNTWAPGTGVRPVEITELNDSIPFAGRFRIKPSMTLREVISV